MFSRPTQTSLRRLAVPSNRPSTLLTPGFQNLRQYALQKQQPSFVFHRNNSTSTTNNQNDDNKDANSQKKPSLTMNDLFPAVSKVFLYAFLTYSLLHALWWDLEIEERTKQYNTELDALEAKVYQRVAELQESQKLEQPTAESTDKEIAVEEPKKQKGGWFSW